MIVKADTKAVKLESVLFAIIHSINLESNRLEEIGSALRMKFEVDRTSFETPNLKIPL